jgi:hypothetical protein
MTRYVNRRDPDGTLRRIAVVDGNRHASPKKVKREPFKPEFVKLPTRWIEVLRNAKNGNTRQLAMEILAEAFKREPKRNYRGGDIILSSTVVVGMPRWAKAKAVKELVQLGLIEIEQIGRQAPRVIHIYYRPAEYRLDLAIEHRALHHVVAPFPGRLWWGCLDGPKRRQ